MPFRDAYRQQAALLLRMLPLVAEEEVFALKGGTAINMFIRDMPRLSVDIDLAYLPVHDRTESLAAIDAALKRIEGRVAKAVRGAKTIPVAKEENAIKLYVRTADAQILIEVNPVIRGAVFGAETREASARAQDEFGFAEMQLLSKADLYGGKITAAIERQHPRDLFDIRELLAAEGIDDAMRRAFIIYLISHKRPVWEILNARREDITHNYTHGFQGMTEQAVSQAELEAARETLIETIIGKMPNEHRRFLISFEKGEPNWNLLGVPDAAQLPAVRWRQQNLDKLTVEKRAALITNLEKVLKG